MQTWIIVPASLGVCFQLACSFAAPGAPNSVPSPAASAAALPTEAGRLQPESADDNAARPLAFPPLGAELPSEPVWWRGAPAAQPIGSVSFSLLGAELSDQPGAAPHRVCRGAPALIVDARSHAQNLWVRVLGGDGSVGWTRWPATATSQRAALYAPSGKWDLVNEAAGLGSPDTEHAEVTGPVAKVVGAAPSAQVARMDHLGLEADHNVALAPWLEVEVGNERGFVPAFEYTLAWQADAGAGGVLPLRGLIQRWFWADARTEPACSVELSRIESEFGRVTLRVCEAEERSAWLHVERRGQRPFVVPVLGDAIWIARYTEAELDGDALADWALEVVAKHSHGSARELLVLPGRLSTAFRFTLEPPLETWWVGAAGTPSLWIARTLDGHLEARAYRWSEAGFTATPGWVAHSREPLQKLRAERLAFAAQAATAYASEPERYWVWLGFLDPARAKQASSAHGFTLTATAASPPNAADP